MNQVVLTLLCALVFGVTLTHSAGKLISIVLHRYTQNK